MKISQLGAELFYVDGRMDGQTDMTKLIVNFRNFSNAPKRAREFTETELLDFWTWTRKQFDRRIRQCFVDI
jgi:hypothetical protein